MNNTYTHFQCYVHRRYLGSSFDMLCNARLFNSETRNFFILFRGCEAIRVINWDELLFLSFFFVFVMVVANCNASCYGLQVHCSQWRLLLFFSSGIKIAFVAIWKVSCGELGYCLTRCTNPEIVAKCEQILCMTSCELNEWAVKPKFAQSWLSLCRLFATDNELIAQGEELETLLLVFRRL